MHLPELPPEIWIQIASYVPDADLCELYSVNRLFYELAMNTRYKELKLSYVTKGMIHKLLRAKAPGIVKRVQQLEIDMWVFNVLKINEGAQSGSKRRLKSKFKSFFAFISRSRNRYPTSADEVFHTLLDVVKDMDNIRCFRLLMWAQPLPECYILLLRDMWSLLSRRIHFLSLRLSVEKLHLVYRIFNDLSRLKHLDIWFSCDGDCLSEVSTAVDLASFLNNVTGTLESLALNSHTWHSSHFKLFLKSLDRFSKLKRLDLKIMFDDTTETAQFLNINGAHIAELSLTPFVSSTGSEVTPLATLQLPAIHRLDLNLAWLSTADLQQFWVGSLGFTLLTDLTIHGPFIHPEDVAIICDAFRRSGNCDQLRHVRLDILVINGQVFDHLALAFPRLQSLSICARFLPRWNPSDVWNIALFSEEMKARRYPEWSLYDITIRQRYPTSARPTHLAMQIVAECIPSIRSFRGNGHMDAPLNMDQLMISTERS